MLTYNQFKTELLQILKGVTPPDKELNVSKILKNNDVFLDSVSITDSEKQGKLTPTIYLQTYYSKYKDESMSLEEIASVIYSLLSSNPPVPCFDIKCIDSFDSAKESIIVSVVNLEMNQERLLNIPHRPWHDLAIIYRYVVPSWDDEQGTITITNQLMNKWDISEDVLFQVAMDNTLKTDWNFLPIIEIIKDLVGDSKLEKELNIPDTNPGMYVISNKDKSFASSAILFPDIFERFIQQNNLKCNGLYILPSSIHELIIIPYTFDEYEIDYLKQMVNEVNTTSVERQDILSSSVYFYDPISKTVGVTE